MTNRSKNLLPGLGLIALLIAAQLGAAVHAFEHDLEAAQVKVCGTCVVATQLGGACPHDPGIIDLPRQQFVLAHTVPDSLQSVFRSVVRQRGPPRIPAA